MKLLNAMFKGLGVLVVTSAVALTAAASQRVLVIMKSQQAYDQVQSQYLRLGSQNLKAASQRWGLAPHALSQVDGSIQSTLENLHSVVLQVSDDSEVQKLQFNPDVEMVDREVFYPAPAPIKGHAYMDEYSAYKTQPPVAPTHKDNFVPTANTPWGILAVKAPQAWTASHQGAGVRVMVLDTGIDKDHPSLKANFEKGKNFVDETTLPLDPTDTVPYSVNKLPYAFFDDVGHGSHCSGTIAGVMNTNGFTGVAPQAKILMGKVCYPKGCSNISISEGLNWAIQEKVDVVSMSLGGAQTTPAEQRAIEMVNQAGIVVVAASGNGAADPGYVPGTVSFPAALPTVIAVGAINAQMKRADFSQYGAELAVVGPGVDVISTVPLGSGRDSSVQIKTGTGSLQTIPSTFAEGAHPIFQPMTADLVEAGLGKPEDFAHVNVSGKLALVQRGGDVKFADKLQNALAAHAVGVVVYNNEPGLLHGSITQDGSELPLPLFIIEQTQGETIKKALAAHTKVSATLQVKKTDYSSFDGTSMATPHVAGVVALIRAANKSLSPAQVKQILKSTATPMSEAQTTGAGLVQADKAVAKASKTTAQDILLGELY